MPDYAFSVIQFLIPSSVARELDTAALREQGCQFEMSTKSAPPTQTRITIHRQRTGPLIAAFAEIAARSTGQLVMDAAAAGANLQQALES